MGVMTVLLIVVGCLAGSLLLLLAWALCRAAALEPPTPTYRVGDPTTYRKRP
jgi:hypothetical protein